MEEGRRDAGVGARQETQLLGPASPVEASVPAHLELRQVMRRTPAATLWAARDRLAGCEVVVKVLRGPRGPERAEVEARALARLGRHPHVLDVLAVGVDEAGRAWVVVPRLSGGALVEAAPSPPGAATTWVAQVADALAHAHAHGVVHGDVTPANVLLDRAGRSALEEVSDAVLADFGSATVDGSGAFSDLRGTLVGCTPALAAPERRRGAPASPATDVYGLARTALEALPDGDLGRLPRSPRRALRAALRDDPRRRPTAEVLADALR
jgi:serine/threonine protein kinase